MHFLLDSRVTPHFTSPHSLVDNSGKPPWAKGSRESKQGAHLSTPRLILMSPQGLGCVKKSCTKLKVNVYGSPTSFVLCKTTKFATSIYQTWKHTHLDTFSTKPTFLGPGQSLRALGSESPALKLLARGVLENFAKVRRQKLRRFFAGTHSHTFWIPLHPLENFFSLSLKWGGRGGMENHKPCKIAIISLREG